MNVTPNLSEPTYSFKRLLVTFNQTKRLVASLFVLFKKVFML